MTEKKVILFSENDPIDLDEIKETLVLIADSGGLEGKERTRFMLAGVEVIATGLLFNRAMRLIREIMEGTEGASP